MRNYPKIGDAIRIKSTGEIHAVTELWKPGRVQLDDGSIFYLAGIESVNHVAENFEEDEFPFGEFDNGYHWKGANYPYEEE
jgi:hypothetical protein